MDNLRGTFSGDSSDAEDRDFGWPEDEPVREIPPAAIGQDERRMQVRAYNFWASLLEDRSFPSIEDLDPDHLPDFGPHSVLLDFTGGIENPAVQFLGAVLAEECGSSGEAIRHLSDVPSRSLLSRITDHYLQIIANQAPIGFEAEFVNQRGASILYRGILLPFSSDGETIDFIYGVINWKELADQHTTDELLLEIDQMLDAAPDMSRAAEPMTEWADGPLDDDGVLDLVMPYDGDDTGRDWPQVEFAVGETLDLAVYAEEPAPVLPEADDMELADLLAAAREQAQAAQGSEDRSRQALYAAISRAYDFALAAEAEPEAFTEMLADAGIATQERAPMTPVVKLVFGAAYDKTRLAEYASALGHARRHQIARGELAGLLANAPGGLKGVVAVERQLRREESGKPATLRETPRKSLMRKLRKLEHCPIAEVPAEGDEFALLVARRLPNGQVVLLGEVKGDIPLFEKAARKLLA